MYDVTPLVVKLADPSTYLETFFIVWCSLPFWFSCIWHCGSRTQISTSLILDLPILEQTHSPQFSQCFSETHINVIFHSVSQYSKLTIPRCFPIKILDDRIIGVRILAGAGSFSLRCHVHTGCGTQPASFPMCTGALYLGVKRPGRQIDHSPPPRAEVNNAWSYTSTPPLRLHGVVLS
jgi:hypothetical protein